MFSKIQEAYVDIANSELWSISIKPILKYSVSSLACGSLAQRMWITADQLASDPKAREQVFRAEQRLFTLVEGQRDASVDNFAAINRIGALALGLITVTCILKAVNIGWKYCKRSKAL